MAAALKPKRAMASLLAVGMALLLLLSSPVWGDELTPQEREFLRNKGVVVFISQTHYPPFEFLGEDGDHTGMCIELARWIATRFGFSTRFIDTSFQKAQEALLSGRADVLTSFFYSKKREQTFDFTQVMFKVPASIFVAADRPDIKDLQDLNGKIIAMQAGDYAQEFLESKGIKFRVVWTKNFAEATELVVAGKADAIIGDEQIVLYHIYSHRLTELIKKVGPPLYIGQNCMGLREGQHLLQSILNKGIALAKKNGILTRIHHKWLGIQYEAAQTPLGRYWPYLLLAAGVLVLAALLVWIWNVRLRSLVSKRTEELARSENTLQAILAKSPLGIGLVTNGLLVWQNQAMQTLLGYEATELNGMNFSLLLAEKERNPPGGPAIDISRLEQSGAGWETQLMRKDGYAFDCLLHLAELQRSDDNTTMIIIVQDFSERKRAEAVLRRSEEQFRFLAEGMVDIVWTLDSMFRTTYVSPSVERVLGFTPAERMQQSLEQMVTPEGILRIHETLSNELSREITADDPDRPVKLEVQYYHKDGSTVWAENLVRAIRDEYGAIVGFHGVSRDISERKQAEGRLKKLNALIEQLLRPATLEEKLSLITQGMVDIFSAEFARVWITKPGDRCDLGCPYADPGGESFTCSDRQQCLHLQASSGRYTHIDGEMHSRVPLGCYKIGRVAAGLEKNFYSNEVANVPQVHDQQWAKDLGLVSFTGFRLISAHAQPIGVLAMFSKHAISPEEFLTLQGLANTTAQVIQTAEVEQALSKSEERHRLVVQTANEAIVIMQNAKPVFYNPKILQLTGYSDEEYESLPLEKFIHPDDLQRVLGMHIKRTSGQDAPTSYDFRVFDKNGKTLWLHNNVAVIDWEGRPASLNLLTDITEEKLTERAKEQLITDLCDALAQVKTLSGLLPICSSCKKIRDDAGYWNQIEAYISKHSEAEFSHSICPTCMKKLYPDLADKVLPEGETE